MDELVARLNELTALARTRELTKAEQAERATLRQQYIERFKNNFKSQLKNVVVINEDGQDVTPDALKRLKNEK